MASLWKTNDFSISLRLAHQHDVAELRSLIHASVLGLQSGDYSPAQLEKSLKAVYGVDTRLIDDGTYFVAEALRDSTIPGSPQETGALPQQQYSNLAPVIVGCGGWSRRNTLYGGDQWRTREDSLLDPAKDAAKIRAFFIHPAWARRGIGSMILEACEAAAIAHGFHRLEMGATLTGVPFYRAKGYEELEPVEVPLGNGLTLSIVRMAKNV